jgi:PAS domain-containing protein
MPLPESEADAEAGLPPGERLRALLDNSPDLISRYDRDLKYIFVNKTIRQIRGLPEEAFVGKGPSELAFSVPCCRRSTPGQYLDDIRRVFETGETVTGTLLSSTPSRAARPAPPVPAFPRVCGRGPTVAYVSGISRDVTASRQAEQERQQAYQLLNSIIEGRRGRHRGRGRGKNVLAVNAAARKDFRDVFNKEIAVGENVLRSVAYIPNAVAQLGSLWDRALTGDSFQVVQKAEAPLNGERYFESLFFPILHSGGRYLGAASIARDITERKLQAAKIRELLTEQVVLNQQLEDRNRDLADREAEVAAVNDELLRQQQELHELVQALENRNFELGPAHLQNLARHPLAADLHPGHPPGDATGQGPGLGRAVPGVHRKPRAHPRPLPPFDAQLRQGHAHRDRPRTIGSTPCWPGASKTCGSSAGSTRYALPCRVHHPRFRSSATRSAWASS